jgi:hypothetical protein
LDNLLNPGERVAPNPAMGQLFCKTPEELNKLIKTPVND